MFGSPPKVCHADGTRVIQSALAGVSVVNSGDYAGFRVFRLRRVDSCEEILYTDNMNPGLTPLRDTVDVHTWIKYSLETCNLPLSLCGRVLYTITKISSQNRAVYHYGERFGQTLRDTYGTSPTTRFPRPRESSIRSSEHCEWQH